MGILTAEQKLRETNREIRRLQREAKKLEEMQQVKLNARSEEIKDLKAKIITVANETNNTPAMVIEALQRAFSKSFQSSGSPVRKAKQKYYNPADPSQTWSGRGRNPKWVDEYLKKNKGKDLPLIDGMSE
ncbi:MAG: H-NS histone family protein [Methyloprofundus sp.]|nr:H-NS histone family protein [Methyloprofundus sp.]